MAKKTSPKFDEPATFNQLDYLIQLGANPTEIQGFTKGEAGTMINSLQQSIALEKEMKKQKLLEKMEDTWNETITTFFTENPKFAFGRDKSVIRKHLLDQLASEMIVLERVACHNSACEQIFWRFNHVHRYCCNECRERHTYWRRKQVKQLKGKEATEEDIAHLFSMGCTVRDVLDGLKISEEELKNIYKKPMSQFDFRYKGRKLFEPERKDG